MKRFSTTVAMLLMVSSASLFAANGSGPGAASAGDPAQDQPMEQKMFGQPEIAGDGIKNATQVVNPTDIGNKSTTANESPEPVPTVGDVGVQNAQ